MKKRLLNVFSIAAVLLLVVGCNSNPTEEVKELTGIGLSKSKIEIEVGQEFQLRVWYEPEVAEDLAPEVTWESSKPKVAKVSDTGKVTGVEEGSAVITATCGKFTAECKVDVVPEPEPVAVESISLDKTEHTMFEGETMQLAVIYNPEESERHAEEIVWTSSDESIATVNEGIVKAVKEGNCTITAKCGEHTAECKITVLFYTNSVVLSESSLLFPVKGGEKTVSLVSFSPWTATCTADWVTVTPASGEGNATVTITVSEGNKDSKETLTTTISFQNNTSTTQLTVERGPFSYYFSVSKTKKIVFAPGNLLYNLSSKKWRFSATQYSFLNVAPSSSADLHDQFYWGATGYNGTDPVSYSSIAKVPDADITGTNYDWGTYCDITNGDKLDPAGTWRMLTKDEFYYLCADRENATRYWGFAMIGTVRGIVFLPDNYEAEWGGEYYWYGENSFSTGSYVPAWNNYTEAEWAIREAAGAVFLPLSSVKDTYTTYWLGSKGSSENTATTLWMYYDRYGYYSGWTIHDNITERNRPWTEYPEYNYGFVRLVKDLK